MSFETEGFLSEDLAHRFSNMPQCGKWFDLAFRLNRLGHKFAFTEKEFEIQGGALSDVRALTTMLSFRALSNFQGSILLADRGLIVEARALARCMGESVLCMVGAKFDPEHWKALADDEIKSRKGRSRLLLRNAGWLDDAQTEKLNSQLELMKADWKALSGLDYSKIAQQGGCEIHYVIYRQLSADAGHASLEALFRYITEEADGTIISLQPAPKLTPEIISDTVGIACNFFFLAWAIVIEYFPDQTTADQVGACWEEYKRLGGERKLAGA